ncbi:MAG: rhomboid family intramembrane serine protease [Bacteroidota bacterium]
MDNKAPHTLLQSLRWAALATAALWVIHFALYFLQLNPAYFGIVPREPEGLLGLLSAPLVHADIYHLLSNSGPIFVFMAAMFHFYRAASVKAMLWIYALTGIWVWMVGHPGSHIGASGLVYGFAAFIFFSGVFRWEIRSIALALALSFFYGGMVWGVFPTEEHVSWESHLFGAVAGAVFAWYFRFVGRVERRRYSWEDTPDEEPGDEHAPWNYRQNWPGARGVYVPHHDPGHQPRD